MMILLMLMISMILDDGLTGDDAYSFEQVVSKTRPRLSPFYLKVEYHLLVEMKCEFC